MKALGIVADVSVGDEIQRALAEIERSFGGADFLINNAGTGSNETIQDAPDEKWQHYWDLHVMAAVRLSRGLGAGDAAPRRWRDPEQRLDLRQATPGL